MRHARPCREGPGGLDSPAQPQDISLRRLVDVGMAQGERAFLAPRVPRLVLQRISAGKGGDRAVQSPTSPQHCRVSGFSRKAGRLSQNTTAATVGNSAGFHEKQKPPGLSPSGFLLLSQLLTILGILALEGETSNAEEEHETRSRLRDCTDNN